MVKIVVKINETINIIDNFLELILLKVIYAISIVNISTIKICELIKRFIKKNIAVNPKIIKLIFSLFTVCFSYNFVQLPENLFYIILFQTYLDIYSQQLLYFNISYFKNNFLFIFINSNSCLFSTCQYDNYLITSLNKILFKLFLSIHQVFFSNNTVLTYFLIVFRMIA